MKLEGKRIVVAADRRSDEITALVEKLGGEAVLRPLQGTSYTDEALVVRELEELLDTGADWVIFTTGVGAQKVWDIAQRCGQLEALRAFLQTVQIAARGRKTTKFLVDHGIEPDARDDDGTTYGVLRALEPFDVAGKRVVVQLHGDLPKSLDTWCVEQRANVSFIHAYTYLPPEADVLEALLMDIVHRRVDAVTFTSAQQVRFLFDYAAKENQVDAVVAGFDEVVATAVGKVTAESLRENGVQRIVAPEEERMGAMIVALMRYFEGESLK